MPHKIKQNLPAQCYGILLAAGKGRRFDKNGNRNKLMELLPSGLSIATTSAKNLLDVIPHSIAVLPASTPLQSQNDQLSIELKAVGCEICRLPIQSTIHEMSASLKYGLQHIPDSCSFWIIALADMPYVKPKSIQAILRALHSGADIAIPVYQGQRGNPVGFSRRYLPQLLALSGDQGARTLLKTCQVTEVIVDDPGILLDIDVPDDIIT